ncbi:MAG: hypothetical protein ABH952_06995 [Candidatus Omnitrophota bacterium]
MFRERISLMSASILVELADRLVCRRTGLNSPPKGMAGYLKFENLRFSNG